LVQIALFGWVPLTLALFSAMPAARALIVSCVAGWLFLPAKVGYHVVAFDWTKVSAIGLSALLATLLFASGRLSAFRVRWFDLPMLGWCLCPFASSIANGLGPYDGLSAAVDTTVHWGVPYLLGRMVLRDIEDLRQFARFVFIGGLIYVPFCWFEMRMSPKLHMWVYGFGTSRGIDYTELGAWGSRPRVFMGDGLTLGMFMTSASLCGFCLWHSGALKRLWGYSSGWLVALLILTSILCKNLGATVLLAAGIFTAVFSRRWRTSLLIWTLVLAAPLYVVLRTTGAWSADTLVDLAGMVHAERAESLQFRLDNEDRLVARALEQPLFGWGRWGRARVYELDWKGELRDISVTDGLWVIALGNTGIVGLTCITMTLLLPVMRGIRRYPLARWSEPAVAPVIAVLLLLAITCVDNLFNAMLNPLFFVGAGGLTTLLASRSDTPAEQYAFSARPQMHRLV
jgi:hypothetical protein